jgi:hypothetical protein
MVNAMRSEGTPLKARVSAMRNGVPATSGQMKGSSLIDHSTLSIASSKRRGSA